MGIGFHFSKDDGPVIERPIRGARDLEGVHTIDAASDLGYVMDTLKLVRHELEPNVALIGFSGAPFTLASYIVEGGHSRNYAHVKKLMYEDPVTFNRLMGLISEVVVDYLKAQIAAGAQVVQVFDSWVGWVSPYDYELLVLPHVRYVMDAVRGLGAPVIYFGNGASAMLHLVSKAGADVYGVDWRIELDRAWDQLGDVAVQGNLDPITLLGPPRAIEERVADIIRRVGRRPGHIFNLGHGLIPQVPPDNVKYLVDAVHRLSAAPI
jgi:uroporphyrinogen decarboxylase